MLIVYIFKHLFQVWCVNAGLQGEVDITKIRYLCEKHFSTNYISNQARRKMLVHTAVPFKWNESTDILKNSAINIVGKSPAKKKRSRDYTQSELTSKLMKIDGNSMQTRTLNKVPAILSDEVIEALENESEITLNKQSDSDIYEIASIPKQKSPIGSSLRDSQKIYKEIVLKPQPRAKPTHQFVYVKSKQKPIISSVKTTSPVKPEAEDSEYFLIEEVAELSSGNIDESSETVAELPTVLKNEHDTSSKPSVQKEQLENYSEFIFGGEKFVQMPKRIFEAEKEKLKKEIEMYKNRLEKIKMFVNDV